MSLPRFTIRVRLDTGIESHYPVTPRAGEPVIAAVRRAVRAATADPAAALDPRADTPILEGTWFCAWRLSFLHPQRGLAHGDVDVPAGLCRAWLW